MSVLRTLCVLSVTIVAVAMPSGGAANDELAPTAGAGQTQSHAEREAVAFVRRYYRRVAHRRFASAWGMLAPALRRQIGPFDGWRAGHARSLGAIVLSAAARRSRSGALMVVSIELVGRDRDVCNGRVVRQWFRGRWVLASRGVGWTAVRLHMQKTDGGRVRVFQSECAPEPPPPPPPSPPTTGPNCQGYDPCLTPGPDYDCAGGDGDGPRYVSGPVSVTGSDPYDLDRDNDGTGCDT